MSWNSKLLISISNLCWKLKTVYMWTNQHEIVLNYTPTVTWWQVNSPVQYFWEFQLVVCSMVERACDCDNDFNVSWRKIVSNSWIRIVWWVNNYTTLSQWLSHEIMDEQYSHDDVNALWRKQIGMGIVWHVNNNRTLSWLITACNYDERWTFNPSSAEPLRQRKQRINMTNSATNVWQILTSNQNAVIAISYARRADVVCFTRCRNCQYHAPKNRNRVWRTLATGVTHNVNRT